MLVSGVWCSDSVSVCVCVHVCACVCARVCVHVRVCVHAKSLQLCACVHAKSLQLCLTLCDPVNCSPVHIPNIVPWFQVTVTDFWLRKHGIFIFVLSPIVKYNRMPSMFSVSF